MSMKSKTIDLNFLGGSFGRITLLPCPKPEWLLLDAALKGTGIALWTAFSPGWKDVFRYVTGFSYSHRGRAVMDRANSTEATMHASAGRFIFTLTGLLDFALFWLAVIDGIRQGLYWFSSEIVHFNACGSDQSPYHAKSGTCVGGWPSTSEWQIGPTFLFTGNPAMPEIGPILILEPGDNGQIMMAFTIATTIGLVPAPFAMRIRDAISGGVYDEFSTTTDPQFGQDSNIVWTRSLTPELVRREIRIEIKFLDPIPGATYAAFPFGRAFKYHEPGVGPT